MTIFTKIPNISATLTATVPVLAFVAGLAAVNMIAPGKDAMQAGIGNTGPHPALHADTAMDTPPLPGDMNPRPAPVVAHNTLTGLQLDAAANGRGAQSRGARRN